MTQYRVPRKIIGNQPAWEAQVREEAVRLGISEKQVKRRVEKELIRLIAEKIAQHEITWQRVQPPASRKIAAQPSIKDEKAPRRKKVLVPGASDRKNRTPITSGTEPSHGG